MRHREPASRPAEARDRAGLGAVLATDPTGVAGLVQQVQEIGVVDLAYVGLVPVWHARDLDVGEAAGEIADMARKIAFHDLAVIEIELQAHIAPVDALDEAQRRTGGAEE